MYSKSLLQSAVKRQIMLTGKPSNSRDLHWLQPFGIHSN